MTHGKNFGFAGLALGVALTAFIAPAASASLIKSYDFDNTLSDTLGNGLDLVASGGTLGAGTYTFGLNQGLRLDSALASTTAYGVEMRFQATDNLGGFNKLIDLQNLASDLGLYVLNSRLDFYTAGGTGADAIPLDTFVTVALERTGAGVINVSLNGVLQFSASDGGQAISGPNILNFFEDDNATSQGEAFAGVVDWIRIHDDATTFGQAPAIAAPAPMTILLTGLGLVLTGWARRRGT